MNSRSMPLRLVTYLVLASWLPLVVSACGSATDPGTLGGEQASALDTLERGQISLNTELGDEDPFWWCGTGRISRLIAERFAGHHGFSVSSPNEDRTGEPVVLSGGDHAQVRASMALIVLLSQLIGDGIHIDGGSSADPIRLSDAPLAIAGPLF